MFSYGELVDLWGQDGIIHFPVDQLGDLVTCGPDAFAPDGAIPVEVPLLFTTLLDGDIKLFSVLNIYAGEDSLLRLVVVGATPDDHDLLFCLDPSNGAVGLLQVSPPGLEYVNNSLRTFVEFLYQVARFIAEGHRGTQRITEALKLRAVLVAQDPAAFEDAQSWWSMAFDLGLARP